MSDLLALADEIERAAEGSRELDARIAAMLKMCPIDEEWVRNWAGEWRAINGLVHLIGDYGSSGNFRPREYTTSLDAARALGNGILCVFASDIGADGQPLVKLVADTTTSPIIEHSGIAATLEMSWCAASLRAIHQGRSK